MRRHVVMAVVVACAWAWSVSAVPLCQYGSSKTDISDLTLNFSYQYHNDPYGLNDRDVSQGQFGVDYVRLFDSPENGFDLSLTNHMTVSGQGASSYTMNGDGNYKRYLSTERDVFGYAGGRLRSSSSFQKLGLTLDLGLGTGRFTDVTPMAKATQIEEYLVKRGTLTDYLHPGDLESLATVIGGFVPSGSISENVAAIQTEIERSGLVRLSGLDALDIAEITRLIQEEGLSRYCGWDLKFGVGYELLDPSGGANDLLFSGAFNYALASTPREQFLLQGSFSGPLDFLTTNRVDITGAYDFFISGFVSVDATYSFSRETWAGEPTDTHQFTVNLKLSPIETASVVASLSTEYRPYYLEWNTDFKLSIQMDLL